MRELGELRANLPPYILALPDEENVLDLHFIFAYMPVLDGHPRAEPYTHGVYWFAMTFPRDYPHRAPKVVSHTPNGRFVPGMSICVAETMFKQSTMNTALSIATVLASFSLFMQDDTQPGHVGWVRTGNDVIAMRTRLALESCAKNLESAKFRRMFPGITNDAAQNRAWIASMKDAPAPAPALAPVPAPAPPPTPAPVNAGVPAPRRRVRVAPLPPAGTALYEAIHQVAQTRPESEHIPTPPAPDAPGVTAAAAANDRQAKLARRRERDRARRAAAAAARTAAMDADVEEILAETDEPRAAAPPAKRARVDVAGSAADHAAAPAADDAVYAPARWLVAAPVIATGGDTVAARIVEAATRIEDAGSALAALAPDAAAQLDTGRGADVLRMLREQITGVIHVREGLSGVIPAVEEIMLRRNLPFDRAAPAPAPAPVPLYPHQLDALPTMLKLDAESQGGVLADPPGFGKTYMIAALVHATLATPGRTVIVAQARLQGAWQRTMQLFGIPDDRYAILSTSIAGFARYMNAHRVSRVVVDEAHLVTGLCVRARNNYSARRWFVTATPTANVLAAFCQNDRVYRHLIRRLPEENTAALPAARETDHEVDLAADERGLLAEAARAAEAAAHVLREFNFRNWPRVEDAVAYAAEATLHGDVQGAAARLAALPGNARGAGVVDRAPSRRLVHNVPAGAAQVERWLATSGATAPGAKCQVCDEPFGDAHPGVLFRACSHLVCTECFDRNYARAQKPFCGLPCAPTTMSACYLLSVLTHQPAEPEPAPAAPAARAGSKTRAILALVAGARARGERVAVVLHSDAAVDAVVAALAGSGERPAVVRTKQGGAHTGAVATAVGGAAPPPVLVAQERAIAVGLNLQQYHYVLLPTPLPDAPRLVQLGGRFVRPGAGVPEVRFVHMHARGTFEARLSHAVRAGGARKMPPDEFVALLRG